MIWDVRLGEKRQGWVKEFKEQFCKNGTKRGFVERNEIKRRIKRSKIDEEMG